MDRTPIGKITHFFDKINVAVIELTDDLSVGDTISIEGHEQKFEQPVDSMQIEHESIEAAKAGQAVGMKVLKPVKPNDLVFKVEAE